MDNISIEAYALCCLLPFIAFLTLAAQIYFNAPPKNSLKGRLNALNDDLLCSMQGLITITEEKKSLQKHDPKQRYNCPREWECAEEKGNELASMGTGRREGSSARREQLTGCNAGLAKMKLINQRYLGSVRGKSGCVWEERVRRARRTSRDGFKPTYLPVIVEGLQY